MKLPFVLEPVEVHVAALMTSLAKGHEVPERIRPIGLPRMNVVCLKVQAMFAIRVCTLIIHQPGILFLHVEAALANCGIGRTTFYALLFLVNCQRFSPFVP